jgi:hypothetical protein
MARGVVALFLSFCLWLACATEHDTLGARNPGDHCIDTCPEGMACTGTTYMRAPKKTYPGRCELLPGRCTADGDCRRSARCVRTGDAIGLCAEAPQL